MSFLVYTSIISALEIRATNKLSAWGEQIDVPQQQQQQQHQFALRKDPPSIMDIINADRAKECAARPDPREHEDCMKFMHEYCKPGGNDGMEGKRAQMNGEPGEVTSGKGYCKKFFNDEEDHKKQKQEPKQKEQIKEEPKPKVEKKKKRPHEELKTEDKDDGKHEEMNIPEQGFDGPLVDHRRATIIDNWTREYGPRGQTHDFGKICREHPENAWCQLKGYSGAFPYAIVSPFIVLLLF